MRTLIAVLFITSTVWAQGAQTPTKTAPQQGPPPKNLTVRPDGHVSANQDPTNPEKFEIHVVVKGETLSGISGEFLKNPRLWPQLWEQNEHIINPHWIYPNDKILIKPVTILAEAKPPEPEPPPAPAPPPPAPEPEPPRRPTPQPPPASAAPPPTPPIIIVDEPRPVSEIKFEDLYCSGSIRTAAIPEDLKVISKALDSAGGVLASDAEYVYLSHGSEDGIAVGRMFQVIRPTRSMSNPDGRTQAQRELGMHYLDVAQLRVVMVQPDFSMARVMHTCADAVDVGDIVLPFQQITIPIAPRPRPFSPTMVTKSGVAGSIVSSKDVMLNFASSFRASGQIPGVRGGHLGPLERGVASEGTIVYISLGLDQSVKAGDVFIVYREIETDHRLYDLPKEAKKVRTVRTAIGELVVVRVGERASTALVTYASDGLTQGDAVERR